MEFETIQQKDENQLFTIYEILEKFHKKEFSSDDCVNLIQETFIDRNKKSKEEFAKAFPEFSKRCDENLKMLLQRFKEKSE